MRPIIVTILCAAVGASAGCQASSGGSDRAGGANASAVAPGSVPLTDTTPIATESATLTVGGLGCPLCANNIENKLSGMTGVQSVSVDLAEGMVKVHLWGKERPSPAALAKAVRDSGFTPTRIQTP